MLYLLIEHFSTEKELILRKNIRIRPWCCIKSCSSLTTTAEWRVRDNFIEFMFESCFKSILQMSLHVDMLHIFMTYPYVIIPQHLIFSLCYCSTRHVHAEKKSEVFFVFFIIHQYDLLLLLLSLTSLSSHWVFVNHQINVREDVLSTCGGDVEGDREKQHEMLCNQISVSSINEQSEQILNF